MNVLTAGFVSINFYVGEASKDVTPLFVLDKLHKTIPQSYDYTDLLKSLKIDELLTFGSNYYEYARNDAEKQEHTTLWLDSIKSKIRRFFHATAKGYSFAIDESIIQSVYFYAPYIQYFHRFDSYHITFFTKLTYFNGKHRFLVCEEIPDRLKDWDEINNYIPIVFEQVVRSIHVETDTYRYSPDDAVEGILDFNYNTIQSLYIHEWFGYDLRINNAQISIVTAGSIAPTVNLRNSKTTVYLNEKDVLIGIADSKWAEMFNYDKYMSRAFELLPKYSIVRDVLLQFIKLKFRKKLKGLEFERYIICKEFLLKTQRLYAIQFSKDVEYALIESKDKWKIFKGSINFFAGMAGRFMSEYQP